MYAGLSKSKWPAIAVLTVTGLFCVVAWAMPPYQDALFVRYPNAAVSLSNCIACHDGPGANSLNAFGNDVLANGIVLNAALDALDSDSDGATNGAELNASPATGPGDPNSRPGTVTTPGTPATPQGTGLNYTGLWWNSAEAGWGINVNHQGDTLFATLFTYDETGNPMWLVMSAGKLQADGRTYMGGLDRASGPAFNAAPFTPVTPANLLPVGTMSLTFATAASASLTYTYRGVSVTKTIAPQVFGTAAASCGATAGSRAALTNYQDLWWNPAESGWGVSIAHQNDTLFATLFTYDLSGNPLWLVMSAGVRQPDGAYLGDLYMTRGPAFSAQPFTPLAAGNVAKVGTMRFAFTDGNNGSLAYAVNGVAVSKSITRQVFAATAPSCTSPVAPPTTPVPASGADLYGTYCARCHGALANSTKAGATLTRTQSAIFGNVGGMGYLSTLTTAQLEAIVASLASVSPPPPPPVTDGPTLYANYCASCHGALANSTKGGASATRIQTAIAGNVGNMGYLSTLSPTQVSAIAATLATVAPPANPATCGSCHGLPPKTGEHGEHRSRSCSTCHGPGYSASAVNAATHNNGIRELLSSIGWNPASRSCANSCHGRENW